MAESIEKSEIEASFRNHRKELLAYCLRRLDRARADDAAADVFAVAWRDSDDAPSGVAQVLRVGATGIDPGSLTCAGTATRDRLEARPLETEASAGGASSPNP